MKMKNSIRIRGRRGRRGGKKLHSFSHNISLPICDKDTLYSHSCVKHLDNIMFIFTMVNSCFSREILRRKIGID